jgi:hypothetical protein
LRVLLATHPRESWKAHPDFHGLVSFWLERHMMFRQLMDHMTRETEAFLDGNREAQGFAEGVARYGGLFVNQLHGHHHIEDHALLPASAGEGCTHRAGVRPAGCGPSCARRDPEHGSWLRRTARSRGRPGLTRRRRRRAQGRPDGFERLIGRHLEDEEDLIVPVILIHGADGLG